MLYEVITPKSADLGGAYSDFFRTPVMIAALHRLNGQEINIKTKQSKYAGFKENGKGKYFWAFDFGVITSYSIHYTKLYE